MGHIAIYLILQTASVIHEKESFKSTISSKSFSKFTSLLTLILFLRCWILVSKQQSPNKDELSRDGVSTETSESEGMYLHI